MFTNRVILLGCAIALAAPVCLALLEKTDSPAPVVISDLSTCAPLQHLNAVKDAHEAAQGESAFTRAFALLFPFADPAYNSLLATFYISSFPNLILGFIPADIDLSSLSAMLAFSTGGLLGDVFLHLLPHSFLGEPNVDGSVKMVMLDPRRNIVVGLAIFGGFALFFLMDRGMRYLAALTSPDGQSNGHSHSHSLSDVSTGKSSAVAVKDGSELKQRGSTKEVASVVDDLKEADGKDSNTDKNLQLGAYLNLFADFTHNITDGLALSAAFHASPSIGATTALACFAHEIPHEIGDYSILIKAGGFTKWQAMQAQFVTAAGAFLGTFIGNYIQQGTASGAAEVEPDLVLSILNQSTGILGTSATPADLVIPAVAGSFIYVASVTVVPELLEGSTASGRQMLKEVVAMLVGVAAMALLSWYE